MLSIDAQQKQRSIIKIAVTLYLTLLIGIAYFFRTTGGDSFPLWSTAFFVILLLSIAVFPLINSGWWGKNYGLYTFFLSLPAILCVVAKEWHLLIHAMSEYVSFIILLGSLFVIAGGVVIKIGYRGTPKLNCILMLIGSIFASFIGTTGASMVLIRPMIRANRWRKRVTHIFVFFIFLVSNIGGLLTPLGDPPLFLGFLRGVPFAWTFKLFPFWVVSVGIVLIIFYFVDARFIKKERGEGQSAAIDELAEKKIEVKGKINFLFLAMVVGSLFLPAILRELVMITAAGLSVYFTPLKLRQENSFTYHPIIEVAILFAGIFITMIPVMQLLEVNGSKLGVTKPWQFFWMTGSLSSFLDNAPTYLVFFSAAQSVAHAKGITQGLIMGVPEVFLRAISTGAVFMGANTYIGNGPNFMVKAICEENEISMPSFFGYIGWSVAILIPVFLLVSFVFF